jgi:hypothetical protein
MRVLKDSELKTFEQILKLSQPALKKVMSNFIKKKYPKDSIFETKDFIIAQGNIPIALAAHMDTVFDKPPKDIFYDTRKNVMWSPEGLGADDRAGVFAIIQIVQSGLRPHIILTTDEEKGCIGAEALSKFDCPFEELNYVIELDRRGTNDCVFYDCDNKDFVDYVEKFGFTETWGSFSDICEFCPEWEVAGVNLSIGYKDEHSFQELLYVSSMFATIEKVKKMLSEENIPFFKYIPSPYYYNWKGTSSWSKYTGYDYDDDWYDEYYLANPYAKPKTDTHCVHCGKDLLEEEMFPVDRINGKIGYFCPDCIVDNVGWCKDCGDAFELKPNETNVYQCYTCREIHALKPDKKSQHGKGKKKGSK